MKLGANAAIIGRTLSRLESTSKELSDETGRECMPLQADVRKYSDLESAVAKTVERFGKIDFVICGTFFFVISLYCNYLYLPLVLTLNI